MSQDGQKLFVNRSREYLIEVLDIDQAQIIRRFNRDYPSIKHVEEAWEKEFRKRYDFPEIKYEIDIDELWPAERFLWVKTSTADKKKGDLFDVFNEKGQFIDSFYLGLKGRLLAIANNFLYLLEEDKADNLFLSKYKIIE